MHTFCSLSVVKQKQMQLLLRIYLLFWIPLGKCHTLTLGCNRTYSLISGVRSIVWPDICRESNGTVNCKYVRTYPLQQKSIEVTITCFNQDFCSWTETYSDLCYYVVIGNGTLYQTCICCGQFCDKQIHQPRSRDIGRMLANVNSFWITSDISVRSIIFMLASIFTNFCIFIATFDDLTYLCIFMWAYLAKLWDSNLNLPRRCKLKSMGEFLEKHKLSTYCAPRNLFVFMKSDTRAVLDKTSARDTRHIVRLERNYQNIQIQAKNTLFLHYLIKRIAAIHSVRIRLDDLLRPTHFEFSVQETSK